MFSRVQNRNTGYSENLFSHNTRIDNNTLNSIDGATALKLDESFEIKQETQNNIISNEENNSLDENFIKQDNIEDGIKDIPPGVSIESASYIESNKLDKNSEISYPLLSNTEDEEHTPELFSDERYTKIDETNEENIQTSSNNEIDQLFDQDINNEEDFEIPAFLRKQKF